VTTTSTTGKNEQSSLPKNGVPKENPREWRNIRFEVLEKVEDLPSFNSVVLEFVKLARREFFSAKDFETVICKDQALVARLLKVANCGLYGRSRTINSIPEAIVLIGLDNLKRIVYAVSSQGMMCKEMTHYGFDAKQGFWIHSMAVGQAAQILAECCPECGIRGEESFVSGLLHDVAKLVLDGFLGNRPHKQVSLEMERSAVGLDHCELAGLILKQWNIPVSISGPVSHHHDFLAGGEATKGAAILSLARGICAAWNVGEISPIDMSRDIPMSRFAAEMEELGLDESRWESVIWNIRQSLSGMEKLFDNA
jgi:HD-like signal output (HDOD) protein